MHDDRHCGECGAPSMTYFEGRTFTVEHRGESAEVPDLRGWSEKEGSMFVQPPIALLERMVALRLHLDDCTEAPH